MSRLQINFLFSTLHSAKTNETHSLLWFKQHLFFNAPICLKICEISLRPGLLSASFFVLMLSIRLALLNTSKIFFLRLLISSYACQHLEKRNHKKTLINHSFYKGFFILYFLCIFSVTFRYRNLQKYCLKLHRL
jgi:hypothetical protein